MISFKIITDTNAESILSSIQTLSQEEREVLIEIINAYAPDEENSIEYAISYAFGCALIRVFDMGRYLFLYPYEVSSEASVIDAIRSVAEYAMREELPLSFSDVPIEELSSFSGFRHISIDAEDAEASAYRVNILTECALLAEFPEVDAGRVKLNAISDDDTLEYARLSKSENVNKYWGYDYSEDEKSPADDYFIGVARRDFAAGLTISLAIRENEKFVGEAIIYAFDGMGSAEFAVRLLPEAMGRGLGRESVKAVFLLASKIGLVRLRAKVLYENTPSHAMLCGLMEAAERLEDGVLYYKAL